MAPAGRGICVSTLVKRDTAPAKGTAKANPISAFGCHHKLSANNVNTTQVSPKMVRHAHSASGSAVPQLFTAMNTVAFVGLACKTHAAINKTQAVQNALGSFMARVSNRGICGT